MEKTAAERGFLKIELIELELDGPYFLDPFRLISSLHNDNTIGGYLDAIGQELEIIFNESAPEVEKRAANGTISVSFEFPEPIQVACEQYLVYFVQFPIGCRLKRLG